MTWKVRSPDNPDEALRTLRHQEEFAQSSAMTTYLAGGWGSGKTVGGLAFVDQSLWDNPGCTGLVMAPTYKLMREFEDFHFRPAFADMITAENKAEHIFWLKGDRRVVMLSGLLLDRLEMFNAAWAYIDEAGLIKSPVFHRMTARLRDQHANRIRLGLTGTPHFGWLKDEFEGRDDEGRKIIHAKTMDNPHLHPDFLANMLANCPARLRSAYLEGEFVAPGGSVYPEFDEAVHVVDWRFNADWPVICSIDWSPRTPHVMFAQLIPEHGKVAGKPMRKLATGHQWAGMVVFDELVPDGTHVPFTTERLCSAILDRGYNLTEFVADPAGKAVQETSGLDPIRIARQMLGVPWVKRNDAGARLIVNGVDHVKGLLEPLDGIARLYFDKGMIERGNTLARAQRARAMGNAIRGYSYPEEKDGAYASAPVKDGICDHAMDVLRYATVYYFPAKRLMARLNKGN